MTGVRNVTAARVIFGSKIVRARLVSVSFGRQDFFCSLIPRSVLKKVFAFPLSVGCGADCLFQDDNPEDDVATAVFVAPGARRPGEVPVMLQLRTSSGIDSVMASITYVQPPRVLSVTPPSASLDG